MKPSDITVPQLSKQCNESLILSVLAKGKKHGYQVALEVEDGSDGFFKFNHGTLYPILHKLEKEGLIKGNWKQEGPKRKRKYYQLTAKGRKYLASQKESWRLFMERLFHVLDEDIS
ncbi:helix-turn-helix transcriptional regulator [bacterium]|nr:helix-turn-helix transcriptional regulator [bacterium]